MLDTFQLCPDRYCLNQLRYDLRKMKAHGLVEGDGRRYAYRLTAKGIQLALLLLFFHKRLCGPLANSRFHHRPTASHRPNSKLEAACYNADAAGASHNRCARHPAREGPRPDSGRRRQTEDGQKTEQLECHR